MAVKLALRPGRTIVDAGETTTPTPPETGEFGDETGVGVVGEVGVGDGVVTGVEPPPPFEARFTIPTYEVLEPMGHAWMNTAPLPEAGAVYSPVLVMVPIPAGETHQSMVPLAAGPTIENCTCCDAERVILDGWSVPASPGMLRQAIENRYFSSFLVIV